MAELALGVVGVIPVISMAFKSGRALRKKLRAFRHYSDDLCSLDREFQLESNFLDRECKILLRLILDENELNAMKADEGHSNWLDKKLESDLKSAIGTAYDDYYYHLGIVNRHLKDLEGQIQCFESLSREREEGERLSATVRRLKKRTTVAFRKEDFRNIHHRFRETNRELVTLRDQIDRLQQPEKVQKAKGNKIPDSLCQTFKEDWGALRKLRHFSDAFYDGLQGAWSCGVPNHGRHLIKLFLETIPSDTTSEVTQIEESQSVSQLNVAIVGFTGGLNNGQTLSCYLKVMPQDLTWVEKPIISLPSLLSNDDSYLVQPPMKRENNSGLPVESRSLSLAMHQRPIECLAEVSTVHDLSRSPDICSRLTGKGTVPNVTKSACLGYLDVKVDEPIRCSFYGALCGHMSSKSMALPLTEILQKSTLKNASFQDRLKIAKSVARAGLTYYSTSWLGESWSLKDFGIRAEAKDLASALQSMHLDLDLRQGSDSEHCMLTPNDSNDLCQKTEDDLLRFGIKSKPLWSLGVALLMIDKWEEFDPIDVVSVRRAAGTNSNFGEKYRELVDNCLESRFNWGQDIDLDRPKTHWEVYRGVVVPLEKMVEVLSIYG